jgi:hypothetical protein
MTFGPADRGSIHRVNPRVQRKEMANDERIDRGINCSGARPVMMVLPLATSAGAKLNSIPSFDDKSRDALHLPFRGVPGLGIACLQFPNSPEAGLMLLEADCGPLLARGF